MKRSHGIAPALGAALLAWMTAEAAAHPGYAPRQPTAAAEAELPPLARQGSFVTATDEQVQLRRDDDSLVSVKLSQLSEADLQWVVQRLTAIQRAHAAALLAAEEPGAAVELKVMQQLPWLIAQADRPAGRAAGDRTPEMARAFDAFVKTKAIKTRWDRDYFYVESNGIPEHQMMVGITAWQQQVPLPQPYAGDNAWRIPLHPVPAKNPRTAKGNFLRGAIALAVNGIPIFNPLNNRGDDALLFGELDEFGGHCGRADDYHYHIAPVHLEKTVGKGRPIAYALDGYPIYGYDEPDGSPAKDLDAFNGHKDADGHYHYHATKTYPYLNGGFYGEVVEREGQVDPQPRAGGVRPALPPLRGAKITDFVELKPGSFRLTYDIDGRTGTVSYTLAENGSVKFVFVDTAGRTTTETYAPRQRGPGGNDRPPPPGAGPATKKGGGKKKEAEPPPPRGGNPAADNRPPADAPRADRPQLAVTSAALDAQGRLGVEYTCDGASASPPVAWKNVPAGTKSFAVSLWHVASDKEKSYWLVYNIPADVAALAKNSRGVGTTGLNDKRRAEYDPMCSKGPGVKTYHFTVYALSRKVALSADQATRANLLAAIQNTVLAEGTLDFQYERKGNP